MTAVALWLLPDEAWHARLTPLLASVAREQRGEPFEPHLTLHVDDAADPQQLREALPHMASRLSPLTLRVGPTEHDAQRFKALFLTFGDARLQQLQALAVQALGLSPGYELRPHLSLLYREGLPEALREDLAARHDLRGNDMRFNRIALVRPAPGRDWSDVRGWDASLRCPLGG